MTLHPLDVPVAYSMVALVNRTMQMRIEPFQSFMCYWSAFNNIYVTFAEEGKTENVTEEGRYAELRFKNGKMVLRSVANLKIPSVKPPKERVQIHVAFSKFNDDLKHCLVTHPSTEFFVYRTPKWREQEIEFDARGQRLNDVLNVGYTTSIHDPVWSPIDTQAYERYQSNPSDNKAREQLAEQILDLIYTVRNNTFHGSKSVDDASDREVIERAFPLLKEIVDFFLQDGEYLT